LNVIRFLEDAELIAAVVKEEKGGKKEVAYALTGNRAEMEVLRRRLFKFL
jgi:glycerol-3-phosphate O-acyltransferase